MSPMLQVLCTIGLFQHSKPLSARIFVLICYVSTVNTISCSVESHNGISLQCFTCIYISIINYPKLTDSPLSHIIITRSGINQHRVSAALKARPITPLSAIVLYTVAAGTWSRWTLQHATGFARCVVPYRI